MASAQIGESSRSVLLITCTVSRSEIGRDQIIQRKKHVRFEDVAVARNLQIAVIALLVLIGCTQIKPVSVPGHIRTTPPAFSHDVFHWVLQHFVDDQGLVDYAGLKEDTQDLDRYYVLLSSYSPDSHPSLFLTVESKLAYWINAYNAAAIKTVLAHYPISSVRDIKPPFPLFFLPDKSGFFVLQRLTFGGKTTSLYYLENGLIRKHFREPLVHFALNCAARGCPRLPKRPFTARNLHEQLDQEARKFLAEERNLRIDHRKKKVFLSSILDWYEDDFLDWYKEQFPNRKATLLSYVLLYLPAEKAEELRKYGASYQVNFIPYDWRLNDKN